MKTIQEMELQKSVRVNSDTLRALAVDAGRRIMDVYARDFNVETKPDESPLTEADMASHNTIVNGIASLPALLGEIPLLSEEGVHDDYDERRTWRAWWLIDPLDGTKEFVKRNGEFTVNIALMIRSGTGMAGYPLAGWVYAPVPDVLYEGLSGYGALRIDAAGSIAPAAVKSLPVESPHVPPRIVASRSHRSPETEQIISAVARRFGTGEIVSSGSSLKLCRIAEGAAELYPRAAPTMEWDTAAADAVCRASGASVVDALTGEDLKYGKENLLNPWFLVSRDETLIGNPGGRYRPPEISGRSGTRLESGVRPKNQPGQSPVVRLPVRSTDRFRLSGTLKPALLPCIV